MTTFNGFYPETITFFENLKENNHKDWFEDHKADYEKYVKQPSCEFVVAMGDALREISPNIRAVPKVNQSLFRLNRDVRFSKDKSPYKTHFGLWLWEGSRKRMENSGFYLHLEGDRLLLGAGIYRFPKPLLEIFRRAVVDEKRGPELLRAVSQVTGKKMSVGSKHYKRVPVGFQASGKTAELLLYNGLHAGVEMPVPKSFFKKDLIDFAYRKFETMLPIHAWLRSILL